MSSSRILLWSYSFLFLIPITNAFVHYLPEARPGIVVNDYSLLVPIDTIGALPSEIVAHNTAVRTLLLQLVAIDNSAAASRESAAMQFRGFFVVILAGLLSLLLKEKTASEYRIGNVLLAAIVLVYLLEVHRDDLNARYHIVSYVHTTAAVEVTNSPSAKTTWYSLGPDDSLTAKMLQSSKFGIRMPRKILEALSPNADQIVLYFVPYSYVLFILWRRRPTSRSQKGS
jgi:hypothetical protein